MKQQLLVLTFIALLSGCAMTADDCAPTDTKCLEAEAKAEADDESGGD